ncbi:uncharacterized protein EURHEDRAFT_308049 [Aspergillus ruber CBS 135680]|uniref:Uncharacterized protein n=1 Tax=Aspergillus ruber (strain CBS 135680) TaxID=1388766 RepID=A0A017S2I5_ASPRC|nr:uncharacterized protein EURHEDRAFT_308049 [Aspergillus ruber CBS 135680]EYE90385.1 hypothetical protein EURHEDRAFT_308049 [Aspergillus ruber CBS 135680]
MGRGELARREDKQMRGMNRRKEGLCLWKRIKETKPRSEGRMEKGERETRREMGPRAFHPNQGSLQVTSPVQEGLRCQLFYTVRFGSCSTLFVVPAALFLHATTSKMSFPSAL